MTSSPRGPRITDRDDVPDGEYRAFDHLTETRGSVHGPFPVLLNSPALADRVARVGTYIRYEGVLPDPVREAAILTAGRAFECPYEWAIHEPIAREAGVSAALIDAIAEQSEVTPDDDERLAVAYGRALLGEHDVPDALFEQAKEQFGARGVTELTTTLGYYGLLACLLNAFRVLPDADAPGFA